MLNNSKTGKAKNPAQKKSKLSKTYPLEGHVYQAFTFQEAEQLTLPSAKDDPLMTSFLTLCKKNTCQTYEVVNFLRPTAGVLCIKLKATNGRHSVRLVIDEVFRILYVSHSFYASRMMIARVCGKTFQGKDLKLENYVPCFSLDLIRQAEKVPRVGKEGSGLPWQKMELINLTCEKREGLGPNGTFYEAMGYIKPRPMTKGEYWNKSWREMHKKQSLPEDLFPLFDKGLEPWPECINKMEVRVTSHADLIHPFSIVFDMRMAEFEFRVRNDVFESSRIFALSALLKHLDTRYQFNRWLKSHPEFFEDFARESAAFERKIAEYPEFKKEYDYINDLLFKQPKPLTPDQWKEVDEFLPRLKAFEEIL